MGTRADTSGAGRWPAWTVPAGLIGGAVAGQLAAAVLIVPLALAGVGGAGTAAVVLLLAEARAAREQGDLDLANRLLDRLELYGRLIAASAATSSTASCRARRPSCGRGDEPSGPHVVFTVGAQEAAGVRDPSPLPPGSGARSGMLVAGERGDSASFTVFTLTWGP